MKSSVIRIFSFLFFLASFTGVSQNANLDSLKHLISNGKDDTVKVNTYFNIGKICYDNNNKDTAMIYYSKAVRLAQKLNYKKGISKTYVEMGYVFEDESDYPMALEYYLKALKINQDIENKSGIGNSYLNIGNIYRSESIYPKALENYLNSLKLFEALHDQTGIGKCYLSMGNVYLGQLNFPKALDYYIKSIKIFEAQNNKSYLSLIYGNTGLVYEREANYVKALEYQIKALKMLEELGNKAGIGRAYNNIGNVYSDQQNNQKALEYFLKSLSLCEEIDDKATMADCLLNIGTCYNHLKNYSKAIEYLNKAKQLQIEIDDIDGLRITYESLSNSEKGLGNFKNAYEFHVKFKDLTDSIFNIENTKQLSDFKTNFEVEKKEAELKAEQDKKDAVFKTEQDKKELEIRNQKLIRNVSVGGLILLLILVFYVYRNLKQSKIVNEMLAQQKVEILNKNQDLHSKNNLIEYQKKEITDSIEYAKTIQHAMLPNENEINEIFPQSFVLFKPKDIVSGDFYWFRKFNDIHFVAAVDCTGHGVPGAFMSMIGNDKLNFALQEKKLILPSEILSELNRGVKNALKQNDLTSKSRDGMDIVLCAFDFKNKTVNYSGANRTLYHISNGELKEYAPTKSAIGGFTSENFEYALNTIKYKEGDIFYLFTDGYADQFGGDKGKKLMIKNFKQHLLSISNKSMETQKQELDSSFEKWRGEFDQIDDVLVIGVRL